MSHPDPTIENLLHPSLRPYPSRRERGLVPEVPVRRNRVNLDLGPILEGTALSYDQNNHVFLTVEEEGSRTVLRLGSRPFTEWLVSRIRHAFGIDPRATDTHRITQYLEAHTRLFGAHKP